MLLARMSQHKNRNRRRHLVDELKNIPQKKKHQTNKRKPQRLKRKPKKKKKPNQINKPKGCPAIFC